MMLESINVAGTPISVVNMRSAIAQIRRWVAEGGGKYVCAADVHSVMRARGDEAHRAALAHADMITADGLPLSIVARLKGVRHIQRVCGPDLMRQICTTVDGEGLRHFFYGGTPEVLDNLIRAFRSVQPALIVAGSYAPPFRPAGELENDAVLHQIRLTAPDLIWIGLGCPKQEIWMYNHLVKIPGVVLVGVGAAFDFHSGAVPRAPRLVSKFGFEWLFRLVVDPRRMWRRYIIFAPRFVLLSGAELIFGLFNKSQTAT
jgi:N-acetylglucosaminyldiphosphoundecaprenol N-acetyl-beta-D-mannosaminyltransferase